MEQAHQSRRTSKSQRHKQSQMAKSVSRSGDGIYLDYAATTPVDPRVAEAMARFLTLDGTFGNPSSITHRFGHAAMEAVEDARLYVAQLVGATAGEIFWTSGATESINLAIKGVMLSDKVRGRHLVVSALEHKAVLDTAKWLTRSGFEVSILASDQDGMITPDVIARVLRDDTALVSVMHVNNEVGTVTDIAGLVGVVRDAGALLHVDAAQSVARLPLDVSVLDVDLLSLSGHKMYGPKGVGALYVRRPIQSVLLPQSHGGGQEGGLRPGTLATHQIVGMGEAARLVADHLDDDRERLAAIDMCLLGQLEEIEGFSLNGNSSNRVSGIINAAFSGISAESLMLALDDIALSTGSACTSASIEPSHVLLALGLDETTAFSSVRFSVGRFTTAEEIDFVGASVRKAVVSLRSLAA